MDTQDDSASPDPSPIRASAPGLPPEDVLSLERAQALASRALESLALRAKLRVEARSHAPGGPTDSAPADLAAESQLVLGLASEALALGLSRADQGMRAAGADAKERAESWAALAAAFLAPLPGFAHPPIQARADAQMLGVELPPPARPHPGSSMRI